MAYSGGIGYPCPPAGRAAVVAEGGTGAGGRGGILGCSAAGCAFGAVSRNFTDLAPEFMQPIVHAPKHPITLGRFGLMALQPTTRFVRRFDTDEARALYEKMLARLTPAGLLSEDTDFETGELWGNYPQTYSLVGLINCAGLLSRPWTSVR